MAAGTIPDIETLDRNLLDADWPKAIPGGFDLLPQTTERLLDFLGVAEAPLVAKQAALTEYYQWPAAQALPVAIQRELVERILSNARTGLGCLGETEWIVADGPGTWLHHAPEFKWKGWQGAVAE